MTKFGEGIDRGYVQHAELLGDAIVDSSPMMDIETNHTDSWLKSSTSPSQQGR